MSERDTYRDVIRELGYRPGLVESAEEAVPGFQRRLFIEAKKAAGVDAVYFTGEHPIIYFKQLSSFDEREVKELHRLVWYQNRAPLLFVVLPDLVRIYNGFGRPAKPVESDPLDQTERLIEIIRMTSRAMSQLRKYSHASFLPALFGSK